MQLTAAACYAIRAVVFLASREDDRWFTAREIARAEDLPERVLMKILGRW